MSFLSLDPPSSLAILPLLQCDGERPVCSNCDGKVDVCEYRGRSGLSQESKDALLETIQTLSSLSEQEAIRILEQLSPKTILQTLRGSLETFEISENKSTSYSIYA